MGWDGMGWDGSGLTQVVDESEPTKARGEALSPFRKGGRVMACRWSFLVCGWVGLAFRFRMCVCVSEFIGLGRAELRAEGGAGRLSLFFVRQPVGSW